MRRFCYEKPLSHLKVNNRRVDRLSDMGLTTGRNNLLWEDSVIHPRIPGIYPIPYGLKLSPFRARLCLIVYFFTELNYLTLRPLTVSSRLQGTRSVCTLLSDVQAGSPTEN